MNSLGKVFLLAGVSGCLPSPQASVPAASPGADVADPAAGACLWRGEAAHWTGDCVVTDRVIASAALSLDPVPSGAVVQDVEVLDGQGRVVDAINYAYDPAAQSLMFHATEATPRLLVAGAHLTLRVSAVSSLDSGPAASDCTSSTAELEAFLSEIASLGASCEVDGDCELIVGDLCRGSHFAAKSVLTEERRDLLGRQLVTVAQACGDGAGRACETEYPKIPSCDPDTKECVGRF